MPPRGGTAVPPPPIRVSTPPHMVGFTHQMRWWAEPEPCQGVGEGGGFTTQPPPKTRALGAGDLHIKFGEDRSSRSKALTLFCAAFWRYSFVRDEMKKSQSVLVQIISSNSPENKQYKILFT